MKTNSREAAKIIAARMTKPRKPRERIIRHKPKCRAAYAHGFVPRSGVPEWWWCPTCDTVFRKPDARKEAAK